jgi:hypothetical protein
MAYKLKPKNNKLIFNFPLIKDIYFSNNDNDVSYLLLYKKLFWNYLCYNESERAINIVQERIEKLDKKISELNDSLKEEKLKEQMSEELNICNSKNKLECDLYSIYKNL